MCDFTIVSACRLELHNQMAGMNSRNKHDIYIRSSNSIISSLGGDDENYIVISSSIES